MAKQPLSVSCSASVKDGVLTLTAANLSLHEEAEILCDVCNLDVSDVSARILTQEVHAHNDFDAPERVTIVPHPAALQNGKLHITLPPCSVTAVTLK